MAKSGTGQYPITVLSLVSPVVWSSLEEWEVASFRVLRGVEWLPVLGDGRPGHTETGKHKLGKGQTGVTRGTIRRPCDPCVDDSCKCDDPWRQTLWGGVCEKRRVENGSTGKEGFQTELGGSTAWDRGVGDHDTTMNATSWIGGRRIT